MADPAEDDSDLTTTTSANTNTTSTNGGRVNHVMQVSSGMTIWCNSTQALFYNITLENR